MDKSCIVYKTVDFIAKRWSLLILLELYKGHNKKKRYSELKRRLLGITPKMLAARLAELEKNGLVKKSVDSSTMPIKCEYMLTDSGIDFIKIIQDIKKWALVWKFEKELCTQSNCKECSL